MSGMLIFLFEGVLGYLLQSGAFMIGMHGIAQHKINVKKAFLACAICAVIAYFIRSSGLFTFGVHTMLVLLIINAACITLCKLSIRPCILGSILMMILVLLSEAVNIGLLALVVGPDQISATLSNELLKAASAIPGNILLLAASLLIYRFKMRGGDKHEIG